MKKILLLFLLFSFSVYAQDDFEKKLREKFEFFKNTKTSNEELRELKLKAIRTISKTTRDTILKNDAEKYLKVLEAEILTDPKQNLIDVSKIPSDKLKSFRYNQDKFTGNTFFHHKKSGSLLYLYVGSNSEGSYLRFVCIYKGSEWVFFDKITFLIDGQKFEFIPEKTKRDVLTGAGVSEKSDTLIDDKNMSLIEAISNAKSKIEIRFSGERVRDQSLSEKLAISFKETLELYNYLKKEFN